MIRNCSTLSAIRQTDLDLASRFERRLQKIDHSPEFDNWFVVFVQNYHLVHLQINRIPSKPSPPSISRDILH